MTDEEWNSCTNPLTMWRAISGRGSDRKHRLFACACCRRIWDQFPDPANRELVEVVEAHPNGNFLPTLLGQPPATGDAPSLAITQAIMASSEREREFSSTRAYWVAKYLGRGFYKLPACESALSVAFRVKGAVSEDPEQQARESDHQAHLFRCIFGNSMRPATSLNSDWLYWNDNTVPRIAEVIYEQRAFDRLPILADALEEAGCDDDNILNHCRQDTIHAHGCYVIDLILGLK